MDTYKSIRILLLTLLFLFVVSVLYMERPKQFAYAINIASRNTEMKSTYFEIYDKSTEATCNRLIVVKPFDWYILARFGDIFILNQITDRCDASSTPSSKIIDSDTFENVCVASSMVDIIDSYANARVVRIPFRMGDVKFNILDALNMLANGYLPDPSNNEAYQNGLTALDTKNIVSDTADINKIRKRRSPNTYILPNNNNLSRDDIDRILEMMVVAREELARRRAEEQKKRTTAAPAEN